jgi:hypothetical protein
MTKTPKLIHSTIDTVSMQHLCRPAVIKRSRSKKAPKVMGLQIIGEALTREELKIYIDQDLALSHEWSKTCGFDVIAPILTKWMEVGGLLTCDATRSKIPPKLNKCLRESNFSDAGDKLVVRIALAAKTTKAAKPFHIATNDGDFWDPRDGKKFGSAAAPVAVALSEHDIVSTKLVDFFSLL